MSLVIPSTYSRIPIQPPPGSLATTLAANQNGIQDNLNAIAASINQIIRCLKDLDAEDAAILALISKLQIDIEIIIGKLDGIVDASLFNRGPGNTEQLNSATILAAEASITGLPKTLYLKRGTWVIDVDVDLSAMASSLLLAPGAVLEQSGATLFSLPLNVNVPDQGIHFSGDTGFIIPLVGSKITLDPRWWGALETNDSTDALIAFEDACYLQGSSMVIPAGAYGFTDRWQVRMGMSGYGVYINQLDATPPTHLNDSTVYAVSVDNFFVRGEIHIDGANARVGLHFYNCDNADIVALTVENCMTAGIYFEASNYVYAHRVTIRHVIFSSLKIVADGILQVACEYSKYEDCYAYDVNRIHFVSEGYVTPGAKSKLPSYLRCVGEYAHDMDTSATENNGAFWAENTNGANYTECDGINISNAVGQSSRFARAFTVGGGQTEYCDFNYTHCRVSGNTSMTTAQPLRGFSTSGTGAFARVNITECSIDKTYQCVVIQSGIREANITRLRVTNWTVSSADATSVLVVATTDLVQLTVDGLVEENCTRSTAGGSILFFGAATNCEYVLKNSHGISHAMSTSSGDVASATVSDCTLDYGCSGSRNSSFTGPVAKFSRCKLTVRAGTAARLWRYSGTAALAGIDLDACGIQMGTNLSWGCAVGSATFKMRGGWVDSGFIRLEPTTACDGIFEGVSFTNFPAAGAAQAAPLTNVKVIGCTTFEPTGLIIPFQNFLGGPVSAILVANRTQVGAAITNWPAPTVAANITY